MNIDLLKSYSHQDSSAYLDNFLQFGLLQLITLPTRIGNRSATIIDHILTNILDDNFDTGIIISDISDHFPVFYVIKEKEMEISLSQKSEKWMNFLKQDFFLTLKTLIGLNW